MPPDEPKYFKKINIEKNAPIFKKGKNIPDQNYIMHVMCS
jgi:hypothetical protein